MALPSSGRITLQDIRDEFGGSGQTNLKQWYGKGGAPSSGELSIKDFYGLSATEYIHGVDYNGSNFFDGGTYYYYYTEVYYSYYSDTSLGNTIYNYYGLDNWGSLDDFTYWYWILVNSSSWDVLNAYTQMRVTQSPSMTDMPWQSNNGQWGPDYYFGTSGTLMWDQSAGPYGYYWAVFGQSEPTYDMRMEFR